MFDLADRTVLVAGGAGYLGSAICKGLAERRAKVVIADIAADRAEKLAAEIGNDYRGAGTRALHIDVASEESITRALAEVVCEFGAPHVLVNCTAFGSNKRVEELTQADFDHSLRINLAGSFLLAREAARAMKAGGSIIMFSSMYGQVAPDPHVYHPPMKPNPLEYGVAKAGIIQMVRYLAVHWAQRNIRVNAIAPGPFPNRKSQQSDPCFIERLAGKVPLGRIGSPEEIVGAVIFLASDDASYVTGQTITVDGGWTAW